MLPSTHRLHQEPQILNILQNGNRLETEFFHLKYLYAPNQPAKICFITSKKQFSTATTRNRVKRRYRHLLKKYLPQIKPGYQLVFMLTSNSFPANDQQINQTLYSNLSQAQIIK